MDQGPDELEVVASSRWYVLAETSDGYGIWPAARPRTEPPLEVFGEDADGFTAADRSFRRRNRQLRAYRVLPRYLAVVVFVAAPVWVIVRITQQAWFDFGSDSFDLQGTSFQTWLSFIEAMTYALWLGALASLLTLFLLRRAGEPEIDG